MLSRQQRLSSGAGKARSPGVSSATGSSFGPLGLQLPARLLEDSVGHGWKRVVARRYRDDACTDLFSTAPSLDPLVVLVTRATYRIESRSRCTPAEAVYRRGSVGVTAPHHSSRLRWDALTPEPLESVHLHLDTAMVAETADELGSRRAEAHLDALVVDEPLLVGAAVQLSYALPRRAPALLGDSLAQVLAVHLLGHRYEQVGHDRGLPASSLRVVVEYLHAHLAEQVSLDDLSSVVNLSKYYLLRRFAASTGRTPARFLMELRLNRAAHLLRTTDLAVSVVAHQCGYRSPSQFSAAFRRVFDTPPTAYRRHMS